MRNQWDEQHSSNGMEASIEDHKFFYKNNKKKKANSNIETIREQRHCKHEKTNQVMDGCYKQPFFHSLNFLTLKKKKSCYQITTRGHTYKLTKSILSVSQTEYLQYLT